MTCPIGGRGGRALGGLVGTRTTRRIRVTGSIRPWGRRRRKTSRSETSPGQRAGRNGEALLGPAEKKCLDELESLQFLFFSTRRVCVRVVSSYRTLSLSLVLTASPATCGPPCPSSSAPWRGGSRSSPGAARSHPSDDPARRTGRGERARRRRRRLHRCSSSPRGHSPWSTRWLLGSLRTRWPDLLSGRFRSWAEARGGRGVCLVVLPGCHLSLLWWLWNEDLSLALHLLDDGTVLGGDCVCRSPHFRTRLVVRLTASSKESAVKTRIQRSRGCLDEMPI